MLCRCCANLPIDSHFFSVWWFDGCRTAGTSVRCLIIWFERVLVCCGRTEVLNNINNAKLCVCVLFNKLFMRLRLCLKGCLLVKVSRNFYVESRFPPAGSAGSESYGVVWIGCTDKVTGCHKRNSNGEWVWLAVPQDSEEFFRDRYKTKRTIHAVDMKIAFVSQKISSFLQFFFLSSFQLDCGIK